MNKGNTKKLIFYQRALRINELTLVANHPKIAHSLNNLAYLYDSQKEYAKAEPLYQRTLNIYEHERGPNVAEVAQSLNN